MFVTLLFVDLGMHSSCCHFPLVMHRNVLSYFYHTVQCYDLTLKHCPCLEMSESLAPVITINGACHVITLLST